MLKVTIEFKTNQFERALDHWKQVEDCEACRVTSFVVVPVEEKL